MQKELLEKYIKEGYSGCEIAKLTNKSDTTIRYWLKKYKLETNFKSKWYDFPWNEIQKDYDNGGTYRSIKKKFNLHPVCIAWAKKNSFLKFRSHKESMRLSSKLGRMKGASIWTEELKNKARDRMIERIKQDPNNHPNRKLAGNRNKMSFPEKVVFDYLKSKNIQFEHNKYISPYWVDFLIGNVIIEVDGKRWHNPERDRIRDKNLFNCGYKVYRFDSQSIIRDVTILDEFFCRDKPEDANRAHNAGT